MFAIIVAVVIKNTTKPLYAVKIVFNFLLFLFVYTVRKLPKIWLHFFKTFFCVNLS